MPHIPTSNNDTVRERITAQRTYMPSPHRVVWCPPSGQTDHFDQHQFQNCGRFMRNVKLDFRDVQRMHILRADGTKPKRKTPTPEWTARAELTQKVIVAYLENRLFLDDCSGSLPERLARCRAKAESRLPEKRARLQRWIDEYRQLSRSPKADPADLRRLEQQISTTDTEIFVSAKLPEIVASTVYLFYRLGFDSCSVGESLGLKPPHIRQILARLNRTARRKAMGTALDQEPSSFSGQSIKPKTV